MTGSPNQHGSSTTPIDFVASAVATLGRKVRRSSPTTPRYTTWAQIVMTVPSRDGMCCMVTFIDGNVDVWRVDDPHARYQIDSH